MKRPPGRRASSPRRTNLDISEDSSHSCRTPTRPTRPSPRSRPRAPRRPWRLPRGARGGRIRPRGIRTSPRHVRRELQEPRRGRGGARHRAARTPIEIVVDVGYKSEGVIALEEFRDETGQVMVKPGDQVDVLIERTEDRDGYIVLSREKAEKMKVWDDVERAYQERRVVVGKVLERVKGGLAVDIGVRAFLPGSQVDIRPVRNLDALKGQDLRMRVIKVNKKRGNIVLSRKAVLERMNASGRPRRWGARRGQDGHRHGQEHHRVRRLRRPRRRRRPAPHHRHVLGPHQPPERDGQRGRRAAGRGPQVRPGDRARLAGPQADVADPWTTATIKYPVGARSRARWSASPTTAPSSSWSRASKASSMSPRCPGPRRSSIPPSCSTSARRWSARFSASTRRTTASPSASSRSRPTPGSSRREVPVGTKITGKVRNLTEFGAFVEVEDGIDGLIHVSDMCWTKRVKHPSEVLKKGDNVKAVVLYIDAQNQRMSLGLKQLETDVWETSSPPQGGRRHGRQDRAHTSSARSSNWRRRRGPGARLRARRQARREARGSVQARRRSR